uniref:Putative secreted protein n=1 Tax=Ixodes ricinus TaxID=34613 RepID=A0A6B0TVK2_IXORI
MITMCCSTSLQTTLLPPTRISMGFMRIRLASASICLGNVAENITVCRSGRTESTIRITWGSKPMSNMRSASSSTT